MTYENAFTFELYAGAAAPSQPWQIPAINEYQRLIAQKAYEAHLRLRFKGTTPYGREIFRRMLQRAWTLCEQNKPGAISQLESELADFPELHEEFVRMTSRLDQEPSEERWKQLEEESQGVSLTGVAAALILRSRISQKYNQQLDAGADLSAWLKLWPQPN